MKTFLSTLAVTLAFTFTAAPADAALSNADKCNVFRAKTEMNLSKCMKIANLLEAKGKTADRAKCVTKYDDGIAKAFKKFLNPNWSTCGDCMKPAECGLQQASTDAGKAIEIVAAGQELATFELDGSDLAIGTDIQSLIDEAVAEVDITSDNASVCTTAGGTYDAGTDTCSVDITSDNAAIAAAAEQDGCEAANGTWDASVCTPAAVADRDCFREGACGVDGWGYASYAGVTVSSTGCSDTIAGTDSYNDGISSSIQFGCATPTTICATPQSIDSYKSIVCG